MTDDATTVPPPTGKPKKSLRCIAKAWATPGRGGKWSIQLTAKFYDFYDDPKVADKAADLLAGAFRALIAKGFRDVGHEVVSIDEQSR